MLTGLFGDAEMARIFSEEATVQGWLDAERALARAQAAAGILTEEESEAIAGAAVLDNIVLERLWDEAREVGYPILPLVRMIARALPDGPNGRVHYGATTQDIMDTGVALQLSNAFHHLDDLLFRFGEALAELTEGHRHTVLPARTHAQQAVPTTFGNKLAVYLSELTRHRHRLPETRARACVVSLYGAGGTSAALGNRVREVRRVMAGELNLGYRDVAWHVSRDAVAEFGHLCASIAGTCARFAREVIDLSRTEIGEVSERQGDQRGASSTMPQKANPIGSESVVAMAAVASALSSALYRAMEAGHERAAGEWQIEWEVVPQVASLAAGCLCMACEVSEGLQVFPDAMRRNMDAEGGLLMSEAYMMLLARAYGRERAHDVMREASIQARRLGLRIEEGMRRVMPPEMLERLEEDLPLEPSSYVGEADAICDSALESWRRVGQPGAGRKP